MKAVVQTGYGSADVLELREIPAPAPGDGEVLVRNVAASIASGDYFVMHGTPFPARFWTGFPKPRRNHVVGLDFAGVVEAVGGNVTGLEVGDEVYGECRGSCAEYAVADAAQVARLPVATTFEQAAAVPTSACAALQGLRDQGKVQPGQKVLINGASGGVGPFAVQIAKALGAEVTAVCSTGHVELMRSLGADYVIDYTQEDFTRGGPRYDVILDNIGSHPLSEARRALTPQGIHIPSTGHAGMGWIIAASFSATFVRQQGKPFLATVNREDLAALADLIEAGTITPVIDRTYPLQDAREAFRYLDQRHARGKVVISVGQA